jgi:hypothetical protein
MMLQGCGNVFTVPDYKDQWNVIINLDKKYDSL